MQLRGLVALSLCALLGAVPSAYAATQSPTVILTESAAAAQNPTKPVKKAKKAAAKELTPAEQKALEKQKLADEKKAKVDAARKLAEQKKAAAAKAAEEKKLAAAKAAEERAAAKQAAAKVKADALAAKKAAAAKAKEDVRLAKLAAVEEAKQAKLRAAEEARQREVAQLTSLDIVSKGNNGELRSEAQAPVKPTGFLGLFGAPPQKVAMLQETRALDTVLEQLEAKKPFKVKPEFVPQLVDYPGYDSGTIVIDTAARRLYLVQSGGKARRYAIAVGKEGLQYKGAVTVGDKQEWPRWIPTKEMQARDPAKYGRYADGMPGGLTNPLGARAIYLYDGKKDTHLRIHGTTEPQSIGTSASNGCFRMINDHVQDLYSRVKLGTRVIVL